MNRPAAFPPEPTDGRSRGSAEVLPARTPDRTYVDVFPPEPEIEAARRRARARERAELRSAGALERLLDAVAAPADPPDPCEEEIRFPDWLERLIVALALGILTYLAAHFLVAWFAGRL